MRANVKHRVLWFGVWLMMVASAGAQSNVTVRVMAANLTGDSQKYETPQLNILNGLKPDVVAIQEFNYSSPSNGVNTTAAIREMVDIALGTNFVYFRESGYSLPNGIISRYPIIASGSWDDPDVSNRGFAWAQIDLPGTNDLYVVSVHLLTTSSTLRNSEATNLKSLIQANFPANAWIIVAGDFNTDSRSEAAVATFTTFLSDNPIPTDAETGGNPNTNLNRNKPYDYVLPSFSMTNLLAAAVFPSHSFPKGLVFDSRVYTPLTDVPPVQSNDSANGQHMAVLKDFLVPTLSSGALLAVTPASDFGSSGAAGGPFNPSSQTYTLGNTGSSNMTWAASATAAWVSVSPTNGTLAAGTSTNVTVSINATANALAVGSYSDTVVFTNTTNGAGSATRAVNLTVNATFPVLVTNGWTLTAENCAPTNGAVDPDEQVTVSFSLKNTGSAATSNLVATLLASADVISPDGPYTYGVVSTNGTPVAQAFTFTAGGSCGGTINAVLQLQDGPANLGTVSFVIPLGAATNALAENFDAVTAPALPGGWTTSASGAQSNWITSTASADTAPNAAFSPDPGNLGVNELVSPVVAINSGAARLTFRQNFHLAASASHSSTGYSGGVLEIKIGSGSYTDIVAAGGSFVAGGYNRTLSGANGNPLAGRDAWSGDSGGFTTTVVNLPVAAAGQNIQLRWRCAAGTNPPPVTSSGTLAFWNFDTSSAAPTTVAAGLAVSPVTTNNLSAGATFTFFGGNPGSAIAASGFTTNAGPPTPSFSCFAFSITASNGAQASLSSVSLDDRASATGPTKFSVEISTAPSFSSTIYTSGIQNAHTAFTNTPMNTFALGVSNLTGTIYFRLYGYQAGAAGGTWRIDNLNVQGAATSGDSTTGTGWYIDSVTIQDALCCVATNPPPLTPFETWQFQYFGSTNSPAAAPDFDADGDGMSNTNEFLAGTDPTNSVSALRITSVAIQGSNVVVSWTTAAGKTNALQAAGDGGAYTNDFADLFIVTNTVGAATNGVDFGAAGTPSRYYRVRLVP
jgi:endonuclease/exonuclease/phosphatase family metal-dependent hydrolase